MPKSCCILVPMYIFRSRYKWEPDSILVGCDGQEYVAMYAPMLRGSIWGEQAKSIEATGKYVRTNSLSA